MTRKRSANHTVAKTLFILVGTLTLFGLLMIASAGAIYATTRFESAWFFVARQAVAAVLGFGALLLLRRIDYHLWQRLAVPLFLIAVALLVLLFVPGLSSETYGARRWLSLGPLSFQPAEIMKMTLVFYLAAFFAARSRETLQDVYEGLVPFLLVLGGVSALLVAQPDVGTLGVMVVVAGTMYFVAGARVTHLGGLLAAGAAALYGLILAAPYRLQRLTTFLDPSSDPQGAGYQVLQGLIAVGSGALWGRGFGHSLQKFNYLPEPVGDSIFAVFAEEFGFVGSVVLLAAFAALAYCGYRIALRAPDAFGRFVAAGITTWIIVQAFFNIAATTALMPLTGIPLPFVSYGSTSLVVLLAAVGVLLNIAHQSTARAYGTIKT